MLRVLIMAVLVGCFLLHGGAVRCYALSVDFGLSSLDVAAGTPFTVELFADIGKDEQILGWDIDLLFDPFQINFLGATPGSGWVFPPTPLPDDDVSIAGLAGFGLSANTGVYGEDVLLATISFECLTAGTSVLDIYTDDVLEGFQLVNKKCFTWDSTPLTVNQAAPIPEPATIFLFGAGILVMTGVRRKGRRELQR